MLRKKLNKLICILLVIVLAANNIVINAYADSVEITVISQPQDVSAVRGSDAIFNVEAEGEGLTYQWQQLKTDEGSQWTSISSYDGCKTASMTVIAYNSRNGYQYRCVISDSNGKKVTTEAATLNVTQGVVITKEPENCTAELGTEVTFHIEAEGEELSYQWQLNASDEKGWIDIVDVTGCKTNTIIISAESSIENNRYRCTVTDKYGNVARSVEVRAILAIGTNDIISVVAYGANGDDEEFDDRSIQSALDFAGTHATAERKIKVLIPEGTYHINRSMRIHSNTILEVDKNAELVLSGEASVFLAAGDGTTLDYDMFSDIKIVGGTWNANADKNGFKTELFAFKNCNNITIEGATFKNSADHCIMLTGVKDVNVTNCTFLDMTTDRSLEDSYTKEALHIDFLELEEGVLPTMNVTVSKCTFENVMSGIGTHNSSITDYKISNVEVSGCTFSNIVFDCIHGTGWSGGFVHNNNANGCQRFLLSYHGESVLNDNEISDCRKCAFRVGTESSVEILDNHVAMSDNIALSDEEANGDENYDDSDDHNWIIWVNDSKVKISGNNLSNKNGRGVRICNNSSATISDNALISAPNDVGISLEASQATIDGNTIVSDSGIKARYCEVCDVTSNNITSTDVALSFYASNGKAEKNTLSSESNFGVYVGGAEEVTATVNVTNNTIINSGENDICIHDYTKDCVVAYNNGNRPFTLRLSKWADAQVYENGIVPAVMCPDSYAAVGYDFVNISWKPVEGAAWYRVFEVNLETEAMRGLIRQSETEYFIDNLEPGKNYYYIVLSYDEDDTPCYYTFTKNLISVNTGEKEGIAVTSQPKSLNIVAGKNASISVEAVGDDLTYQWQQLNEKNNSWINVSDLKGNKTSQLLFEPVEVSYNGVKYRCIIADAHGNSIKTDVAQVTVTSGITIVTQPEDSRVIRNNNAVFSVVAKGEGLTYQWQQLKTDDSSVWTNISSYEGCTTDTMTVIAYESRNGYMYRCVITDKYGSSVTSEAVSLILTEEVVKIVSQPKDAHVMLGDNAIFSVKAEGTELTYQWQQQKPDSESWTSISSYEGCKTDTMTVIAYESRNGYKYRCKITNKYGSVVYSDEAILYVVKDTFEIITMPKNITVKAGEIAEFTVEATGSSLSYQWYYRKAGVTAWSKWSGHTTATTSAKSNDTWDGMQVYCVVTDGNGNSKSSDIATITLMPELKIVTQPKSVTVKVGEKATFTVEATGKDLSYQWYYKKATATIWSKWSGHTTATTSAVSNDTWNGMQVYCVVTDKNGNSVSSNVATITLMPELKIVTQPKSVTVKVGEQASFSVEAAGSGLSYQWYYRKAGVLVWSKWSGHTTATTSAKSNDTWNGMQVYCVVTDKDGNSVSSNVATITLMSELKIVTQPESVTVKVGEQASFSVEAAGSGLSYQWYYRKAGVTAWSKWSGHTTATTSAKSNDTWDGMQVYCVVTDKDGNSVSSNIATITLVPELKIVTQPESVIVKVGEKATFTVEATGNDLSYQWYYKKATATTWSKWSGHTTATTSAVSNDTWDGMQVYCIVTDRDGNTIASEVAKISIIK